MPEKAMPDWIPWSAVYVLAAALIYAGTVDIIIVSMGLKQRMVSDLISWLASEYPIMPLMVGLLMGHLFPWRRPSGPPPPPPPVSL